MKATHLASPPARILGRLLPALISAHLLFVPAAIVFAQQPAPKASKPAPKAARPAPAARPSQSPDLWVTVFAEPSGKETVAVAYNARTPPAQIKQDVADIAAQLRLPPPAAKITDAEGIPAVEAEFQGLADWKTGKVNLDPLIQTYKRYGRFRASFFFLGAFPLQRTQNFDQPPLRVESEAAGNIVNYRVFIDQSNGVPAQLPLTASRQETPGWKLMLGLAAVSLIVAVSVFLIINVVAAQKRQGASSLSAPERSSGSAHASGGAREGK